MKIHFVCSANAFRSRVAEAYLKSKGIPLLKVSSSGITAGRNLNGPISWCAMRIIENYSLIGFMSNHWRQTTKELITGNDLIIFMEKIHYDFCKNFLASDQKYEIWDIEDIVKSAPLVFEKEIENMKKSEEIFNCIKNKIDLMDLPIPNNAN